MAVNLFDAIQRKDVESLTEALAQLSSTFNFNRETFDSEAWGDVTALDFAVYQEFPEGVILLLARGVDPNIRSLVIGLTEYGAPLMATPLHYVCRKTGTNNIRIAQSLLSHGASPNEGDDFLSSPLSYSIKIGNYSLFELLLNNGGDPLKQETYGHVNMDR